MTAPVPGAPGFRCAASSALRDEPLAGTASTIRAFLLIEDTGPWGSDALRDARLPDGLGKRIRAQADAARVRALLIRRPDRSGIEGHRVFAAYADPVRPWLESGTITDLHDVLDLDLAALRAGRSSGLARDESPLFCVCTHGKHDTCCAERGRPAAAALEAAHRDHTWEVSHIGGDRFAGNMLVLPHGLYYGRIDAVTGLTVAGAHLSGEVELDHLRGRSGLPTAAQYAEIALRRDLGATRNDDVRFVSRAVEGSDSVARFAVGGARYDVAVRTHHDPPERLTCSARRDNPVPVHELRRVARVG
ncbi:MAG: sucrase ferredoxin [Actinomycetota bacterium]|nr:sucrase ferredoxin [Actinomycetota bacterium]